MRHLLTVVVCLLCSFGAAAQMDSTAPCHDRQLRGLEPELAWANSFSVFLETHQSSLGADQSRLLLKAIELGTQPGFDLRSQRSLKTITELLTTARSLLTFDEFSEILAGMGSETQQILVEEEVVDIVACSCTIGGGGGPGGGFTCQSGCYTWGTGAWNGIYKMSVEAQQR